MAETLAFSIDLLKGASTTQPPLEVCPAGHLVAAGRTHWTPERFAPGFTAVVCRWVEHCDG